MSSWDLEKERVEALKSEWGVGITEVGYTRGNPVPEAIQFIIQKWRAGRCIIIGRKPGQSYPEFLKPKSPPQWLITKLKENEAPVEDFPYVPELEPSPSHAPFSIINVVWNHTQESRHKESPKVVREGDVIELFARFEKYVEGAGVDFFVTGAKQGRRIELAKLHARCRNQTGKAEWRVDSSDCDAEPALRFHCVAREKQSHEVPIAFKASACFGQMVDIEGDPLVDFPFVLYREGKRVWNGVTDSEGRIFAEIEKDAQYTIECFDMED